MSGVEVEEHMRFSFPGLAALGFNYSSLSVMRQLSLCILKSHSLTVEQSLALASFRGGGDVGLSTVKGDSGLRGQEG